MKTPLHIKLLQTLLRRRGAVQLLPGLFVLLALFALMTNSALAALIAYEPFDYTSTIVNGAASAANAATPTQTSSGGFSGNWTCSASATVANGLAYGSGGNTLPVLNNSISTAGATVRESLATPQSSGTVYVGFLVKQTGDNGGTRLGLMMVNSSGTGYMFCYRQNNGIANFPTILAVSSFAVGSQLGTSATARTFANTNLYVVKLTYTSGNVSRIDVYSNPTANQGTAPTADFSVTTGLGTSGALAILGQVGAGATFNSDEWRVGTTFGDVVGFAPPIPGVPTGLGAVAGNNSVSLSWIASSDAATYSVKRSATSGSGYVTVGTTTAPTVVFTNSVVGGQTYYYVVSAVNGTGESADSSEVSATPTFTAPAAPTALNGTPGNNTVGLTWTAAAFADSYNVKRSTTSGSGYGLIGTTTSPTVAYTDATAIDGTVYYYVVSAVNGAGEGADSVQKAVTMPPAIPTGLGATPGNNSVSLNWTGASGAVGYRVKRSTVSGSGYVTVGTTATPTVAFNDAIIGGVTYYYVVTATNASGESLVSSEVSATPVLQAPATPATLTATPGNNTVAMTWAAAAFATSYNVKRSTASGAEVTITNVATASFTDSNAVNGTVYYYTVSALNGAGESADTSEAAVTMRPAIPTGLGATPGANQVSISWTASSLATGYKVKRSTVSGSGYVTVGTTADPTVNFTDAIIGGQTYYYVVTATNVSGETVSSSEVSAAPTLAAPSAPTGLAATSGDNAVGLTWTAAAFATSYNVKRSTVSGSGYTTISTTGAVTGTNYTDSTAINGTAYYYVVSGTNAAGESANSSEVSATPNFMAVYEPFNYGSLPTGTASTGTGESGSWTCGTTPSIVSGLTYPALPVANSALSTGGGRQYVSLATPTGSGTKWVSFLFKCSGDPGGNWAGVYLKGDQANSIWAGFRGPNNGVLNVFGLGTVTSAGTTTTGGTAQGTSANIANTTVHLIVMKLDFNTSGTNDTVTLYIDPAANVSSPSVAATTTLTSVNIGTISALGVNIQGGTTMTVDEFRIGQSFGEVVGYNPPAAPTGLVAVPGVNTVGLSWNAVGTATGYKVLRGTSTGVYSVTNSTASNAYADNSAIGGTAYFYVVQATNASGSSAFSSEVGPVTPTINLPDVPAGLTATGTNGAVQLNWSAATGAASYNVKRSTASGTEVTIANVGTTSYYDADVVNGTEYFYTVSSTNLSGESADSSEVSAVPNVPPTAPTGLAATAGDNQVSLTWNTSAGAASYNVKRSTTSGSGYSIVGTTTDPTTAFTDLSAVKFTQYYYVVSAASAYGESSDSSEVSATPTGVYGPSAYEPFNYTSLANGTASTATGFTGNWNVSGNPNIVAGLTYAGLPVSDNSYSHGAAGAQTTVDFANPLSSGTKYVSFLFQGSGDPGGNTCGIFLKGDNASSLFVGFEGGFSPTQTSFGIGTVSSTVLGGATALGSTTPIDNTTVHLVVVAIDFNTSGANDTVSLWIDPPAGVVTPGTPANVVDSSFDVGTISAFGININGAFPIGIDEIRVGDVYGDVAGYTGAPPAQPVITASLVGNQLTLAWPAGNLGWFLQSQTSSLAAGLGTNWVDVVGSETGTSSVITVDPSNPTEFFRLRSP